MHCATMINTFYEKMKSVTTGINFYLKHSSVETWLKDGLTVGKELEVPNCFVPDPDHTVMTSGLRTLVQTDAVSNYATLFATKTTAVLDLPSKKELKFISDLGSFMDKLTKSMLNVAADMESNVVLYMPNVSKTLNEAVARFKEMSDARLQDLRKVEFKTIEQQVKVRSMAAHIKDQSFRKFVPKIINVKLFADTATPQIDGSAFEKITHMNMMPVSVRLAAVSSAVSLYGSEVAFTLEEATTRVNNFRATIKNKHVLVESKEWAKIGKGYSDCFQHFVELNEKAVHIDDLGPLYKLANSSLDKYVKDFREIDAAILKVKDTPYKGATVGTFELKNIFQAYESTLQTITASWNSQVGAFKTKENALRSMKERTEADLCAAKNDISNVLQELARLTKMTEKQSQDSTAKHDQYQLSLLAKSAALQTLKVQMDELKSKYHDQSVAKNTVDGRLRDAENNLKAAQDSQNQLRDKTNMLGHEKQQAEQKMRELGLEIGSLQNQLVSAASHTQPAYTGEAGTLRITVQDLQKKLLSLEQEKTNLQTEKDLVDTEVDKLKAEIQRLRNVQIAASISPNLGPRGPPPPGPRGPPPSGGGGGEGDGGGGGGSGGSDSSTSQAAP